MFLGELVLVGFVVFVPYAVPGDEVEVKLIEIKKSFAVGKILSVLHSSAARTESSGARVLTYAGPMALFGGVGAIPAGYRTVYRTR